MKFVVLAHDCESPAVAIIDAENIEAAVAIFVGKAKTDKVPKIDYGEGGGASVLYVWMERDAEGKRKFCGPGALGYDESEDMYAKGDVHGDLPDSFSIEPLPEVPYTKIGCFFN